MSKQCQNCFYQNKDSALVCEVCGTRLVAPGEGVSGGYTQHVNLVTSLKRMRLGFMLLIAFSAFDIAFLILIYFYSVFFSNPIYIGVLAGQGTNSFLSTTYHSFVDYYVIELYVSVVMTFLIYGFIATSFSDLKKVNHEYSSGYTGTIILMASEAAFFILAIVFLFIAYPIIISSLNGISPSAQSIPNMGLILGLLVLLFIFLILALVGVILFTVGVYRVGSLFDNSLVRAGAIVNLFIPLVGAAFVVHGLTKIIEKLQNPGIK